MIQAHGHDATVHLSLEDRSGDSAIIEYLDGKPKIHHGRQYTIMTNDPPYHDQLDLLSKMDFSQPGQDTPVPGNISPQDRFQRSTSLSLFSPKPENIQAAFAIIHPDMRSVSVTFRTSFLSLGSGFPV